MAHTTLVVMAAGLGSRYGGLKQIAPVDDAGHILIDFSIFDAVRAGFDRLVCIIKPEMEQEFHEVIGCRIAPFVELEYAFQRPDVLPEGFAIPEGRTKPWGTGHAVLCAAQAVDGPFAVINADDFYGRTAYTALYDYLTGERPENEHAMVAYQLKKTVTESGSVARGICRVEDGFLTDVVERTRIEKRGSDAAYTEEGENWLPLSGELPVSMNCWAFSHSMMDELIKRFPAWLDENVPKNPMKCEYFLPSVANALIKDGEGSVRVLNCHETWYGVTYKEDLQSFKDAMKRMRTEGIYPKALLD